jgi:hypothetical protein
MAVIVAILNQSSLLNRELAIASLHTEKMQIPAQAAASMSDSDRPLSWDKILAENPQNKYWRRAVQFTKLDAKGKNASAPKAETTERTYQKALFTLAYFFPSRFAALDA